MQFSWDRRDLPLMCAGWGKVRFIDFPDFVVFVAAEAEARSLRTDNSTSCRRGSWAGGVSLRFGTWLGAGPAVAAVCVGRSGLAVIDSPSTTGVVRVDLG